MAATHTRRQWIEGCGSKSALVVKQCTDICFVAQELEDIRGSRLYCNIFVYDFLPKSEIIRHLKFNPLEKMRVFMYHALWMLTILIAGAGKTSLPRLRPDLLGIHGCNAYMWQETGREAWDWICNYAFEKRASPHQNSFVDCCCGADDDNEVCTCLVWREIQKDRENSSLQN
ncbi:hypothetical protein TRIUR3_11548 [Triticum urartu]|uniref:Uncharacterized protein n=1 Tax=Triticum urartu TaxID=4572 RepID=M7ZPG9_TRIUA|nr:hypothetical protein TRIUR3_11548 [Triticum urartu]